MRSLLARNRSSLAIQKFFSLLVASAFVFTCLENHVHDQPTWTSTEVVNGDFDARKQIHFRSMPARQSMTPCLACLPHPKGDSLSIGLVKLFIPQGGFGRVWPGIDVATTQTGFSATHARGPPSV